MANDLQKKLLGTKRRAPLETQTLAPTWMKVCLLLYLSAWVVAVAVCGFRYLGRADKRAGGCPDTCAEVADSVAVVSMANSEAARSATKLEGGLATADGGAPASHPDGGAPATAAAKRPEVVALQNARYFEGRTLTDRELFTLVILFGSLGGALHGLSSAALHAGRRRLYSEWWMFYVSRPPIGGGTAAVIYLLLLGGVGGLQPPMGRAGEFTSMAWGALAGLFSTVAMQKFRDIFQAVFHSTSPGDDGGAKRPPGAVGGPASPLPPAPVQPPTKDVAPAPPAARNKPTGPA